MSDDLDLRDDEETTGEDLNDDEIAIPSDLTEDDADGEISGDVDPEALVDGVLPGDDEFSENPESPILQDPFDFGPMPTDDGSGEYNTPEDDEEDPEDEIPEYLL